ncbi:MAG: nitroreductase family protein [Fastidiosipilaceae bacterium]|jgi:FMN reductase (NADPH)|nr:NADPH-dependent oxidoreductase [Clostridiaceae bacterium]
MNQTIEHQLNHRSHRIFTDKAVSADIIDTLVEVALRTSTHMHMQAWSIIRVTDQEKRRSLADIMRQSNVAAMPELWIFLVDCRRNLEIARQQGYIGQAGATLDRFMQGYIDACIAAQNVLTAVESLGMGGVFLGAIARDYKGTCEILGLPELTFPAIGLGFGYPAREVLLKPRLPREFRVFENEYKDPFENISELNDFDVELEHYYDQCEPGRQDAAFSKKVYKHMSQTFPDHSTLLEELQSQGFII